jgi:hypothetical protein
MKVLIARYEPFIECGMSQQINSTQNIEQLMAVSQMLSDMADVFLEPGVAREQC